MRCHDFHLQLLTTIISGKGSNGFLNKASLLADVGTTQMEFSTLSKLTGVNEYAEKVHRFSLLKQKKMLTNFISR